MVIIAVVAGWEHKPAAVFGLKRPRNFEAVTPFGNYDVDLVKFEKIMAFQYLTTDVRDGVTELVENIACAVDTRRPDPVGAFLFIIFPEKPPHRAPDAGQIYARARAEPWCCRPGKRRSIARQEC